MAVEFVGYTNVEHTRQPEDAELCFAAEISAASGIDIASAQAALEAVGLAQEDGAVLPAQSETTLEVDGVTATLTPFQGPFEGADDPESILALIDSRFENEEAVMLLHKKNDVPTDERHHWTLLTGTYKLDDGAEGFQLGDIYAIDPLEEEARQIGRPEVIEMITRTLDYSGAVWALALSTSLGPRPQPTKQLRVEFEE